MKIISNRAIWGLIISLRALVLGSNPGHSSTIIWSNTSGRNWSVAANWNPQQVPANTDDSLMTNAGINAVTLDVSGMVTNLTLVAGGGAGGLQMFILTNADSYCTSIAEA